jgi:hypothetical protein
MNYEQKIDSTVVMYLDLMNDLLLAILVMISLNHELRTRAPIFGL